MPNLHLHILLRCWSQERRYAALNLAPVTVSSRHATRKIDTLSICLNPVACAPKRLQSGIGYRVHFCLSHPDALTRHTFCNQKKKKKKKETPRFELSEVSGHAVAFRTHYCYMSPAPAVHRRHT